MATTHKPRCTPMMDPGHISPHAPGFEAKEPDHMHVAVDYVEDLVAQPDDYALEPTAP
jgi:hypothetical protein